MNSAITNQSNMTEQNRIGHCYYLQGFKKLKTKQVLILGHYGQKILILS